MSDFALLKICVNGSVDLIELDTPEVSMELLHEVCDPYDFVRSSFYADVLICLDDEGKMSHKDYDVNFLATAIYGNPYDVIFGDVILGTDYNDDPLCEPDFYAFHRDRAEYLRSFLLSCARAHACAEPLARRKGGAE